MSILAVLSSINFHSKSIVTQRMQLLNPVTSACIQSARRVVSVPTTRISSGFYSIDSRTS
ncbi:hypothetical protein KXD40_006680 [Peronospora effusa]|nr:hypothetical protein KXD40_006680 [Peronospora effusa]